MKWMPDNLPLLSFYFVLLCILFPEHWCVENEKLSIMKIRIIILLFLPFFLSECGPSQKIIGSWADPDAASMGPYKKAFVVVLTQSPDASFIIESQIAEKLASRGFQVVLSTDMFPPNASLSKDYTKEQLFEALKKVNCDAVFTLALLDIKTVETYRPGVSYYPANYGYYGSFYGYYSYYYPIVYSAEYYSLDKTYYLETNFYDLDSDKLLWSVQSEAKNPTDLDEWFAGYSTLLINHLKSKGLNQR